jgi:peptidoglycan/LPS O-acetylase OafA/YrhL
LNQMIVTFWKQRILRIYPLFWIYYFLKYKFQIKVIQFLALDFIRPEILWFIPAIIQCYIIAPFLFVLMNKLGVKLYSIALVAGFIILNAILLSAGYPTVASIAYHGYNGGFFFSHILLFGTGFIIAHLSSTKPETLSNFSVCLITLIFILFLHATTPQTQIHFHGSRIVLEVFFLLFSMLCVYSVLNSNSYLPFSKFFQGLGIYSYSIFLFHHNYFKGLEKIGILEKYDVSPGSILICILLLPVFLASVAYFEEMVNGMVNQNFNLKDITRKYYSNIFRKKYGKH